MLDLTGKVTRANPEEQRRTDEFWARARQWAEELAPILQKSGRYPREHWERVAEVYKEAARWQRNPTARSRRALRLTRSAAAKWVSRARDRGLLPPAHPVARPDPRTKANPYKKVRTHREVWNVVGTLLSAKESSRRRKP